MIVDAQIHVWEAERPDRPWPRGEGRTPAPQRAQPFSARDALAAMNAAGVDRAILVPPSWEGERNDVALAAVGDFPGRFAVMGRIGADPSERPRLAHWRAQPGLLGVRVILAQGTQWRREGADHWLWRAAQAAEVPVMIAPAGAVELVGEIAHDCPDLRIVVDHMGARVDRRGAAAFVDLEALLALGALPNVAVKATCLPAYSLEARPWGDVTPYLRRIFDCFGPRRLFWGSDLSRLPCAYGDLVAFFEQDIDWLSADDRKEVMGEALMRWLEWR